MLNNTANPVPITPPRVSMIDPRTGLIERSWYMFFLSLFANAQSGEDWQKTTDVSSLLASYDAALQTLTQNVNTQPVFADASIEIEKQIQSIESQPVFADASIEIEKQIQSIESQDCCNATNAKLTEIEKQIQDLTLAPVSVEPIAFNLAAAITAATSKTTPVDADVIPLADSAASFALKKLTWANLKATLATWLNSGVIPARFATLSTNGAFNLLFGTPISFGPTSHFMQYETGSIVREYTCGGDAVTYGVRTAYSCLSTGTPVPVYTLRSTDFEVQVPLKVKGGATLMVTASDLTNGVGGGAGTITNAPAAGNPTKWIGINDNGTIRYIPSW